MNILKAKIVWFPDKLSFITEDSLENKIDWNQEHLETVRKYMKEDGLLFPAVFKDDEIHCGHYRFKVAKEMGYDGIDAYKVDTYKEVLQLTKFSELCYKHYKEYKEKKYV
jgi:hypothetical protein